MSFKKITEQPSHYRHLEKMSIAEIVSNINKEDFERGRHIFGSVLSKYKLKKETIAEVLLLYGSI